jgi:hypothetical protein
MWKIRGTLQKPSVGRVVSGAAAEKKHGHAMLQLQFSK